MSRKGQKIEKPFHLDLPFSEALERLASVNTRELAEEIIDEEQVGKGASPFVKWVGGKRNIIDELVARLPTDFNAYYEPFVGGGALFFEIHNKLKKAYLSDTNFELVLAYNVIKKDPQPLIELLKRHTINHNDNYFYKIRDQFNLQDPVEIAARFIYLNKTCYNGLYRVNKLGRFNVPVGKYHNPGIVQESNLIACSKALGIARIELKEFDAITPIKDDFVYFDPPYHPTDETSFFTSYTKLNFTEQDQVRLRDCTLKLHKAGVKIMLSNSNTKFIRDIYSNKAFNVGIVHAPRFVNCKPNKRNAVEEVLITNY